MPLALIRPGQIYAWKGPSLLLVNTRGECGDDDQLSGYYFRAARFLRTLRLEINGHPPWPCEATLLEPHVLAFAYIYPELTEFGGAQTSRPMAGRTISTIRCRRTEESEAETGKAIPARAGVYTRRIASACAPASRIPYEQNRASRPRDP